MPVDVVVEEELRRMIDSVKNTMARMQAIESTIKGRAAAPAATATTATGGAMTPEVLQGVFGQMLQQAGPATALPAGYPQLTNTGLTPAAGPRQNGAPPGLEGYMNGAIPPSLLVPVTGTGELLWGPAASAFEHMRRDAAAEGVRLTVVDGYRTYDDQVRLAGELGLYSEGGLAAHPGTSEHGWGRAVDVDVDVDERTTSWLRANAWKYGFVETVPREPWHWEFHPAG